MSHTPGPWEAWNSYGSTILYNWRIGERNTTPGVVRPIAVVSHYDRSGDEQIANARLIAAAPDLLAACHAVASGRQSINCSEVWIGATDFAIVRAAIAKATGGAQ